MAKFYTKLEDGTYKEVNALSQDEVDTIVQKRLERQSAKYADYDELKDKVSKIDELKTAHTSEIAELKEQLAKATASSAKAKLETAKEKAMREFKVKDSLAEFVTGTTEEEIRARAEKLSHETVPGGANIEKDSSTGSNHPDTGIKQLAKNLLSQE